MEGEAAEERCGHCDNCRRIAAHEAVVEGLLRNAPDQAPVGEQAQQAPAFARGDLVEVRRYGRGVVEAAGATQITVAFADGERRSFLPEYVRRASGKERKSRRRIEAAPGTQVQRYLQAKAAPGFARHEVLAFHIDGVAISLTLSPGPTQTAEQVAGDIGFVIETVLLSIALADRIRHERIDVA